MKASTTTSSNRRDATRKDVSIEHRSCRAGGSCPSVAVACDGIWSNQKPHRRQLDIRQLAAILQAVDGMTWSVWHCRRYSSGRFPLKKTVDGAQSPPEPLLGLVLVSCRHRPAMARKTGRPLLLSLLWLLSTGTGRAWTAAPHGRWDRRHDRVRTAHPAAAAAARALRVPGAHRRRLRLGPDPRRRVGA